MWTSKNNFIPIDSFYYFELNALDYFHSHHKLIITINEITFSERSINDTLDIKNYNFLIVVRNANIIDTISWVDYTTQTNRIPWCNGYTNQTITSSVQYYFNDSLVSNMNDTTLIKR
jgi:hypothetical protein